MIRIEQLSFDFTMNNEGLARSLYAGWEEFYHQCFEEVLEEYLAEYEKQKIHFEIKELDIQLEPIPENEFYQLFPIRLREALERQLPLPDIGEWQLTKSWEARWDNLLHYLTYGFCYAEWVDAEFDPEKELNFLIEHLPQHMHQLLQICFSKTNALERIMEFQPGIPVRIIRETTEEGHLDKMAEILDPAMVKRIMITECENHAGVDIPQYWHYLYNWLIEYYPFNGIAIFGDKRNFRKHMNRKLLSFIRKRSYMVYLSKTELTMQFLLEVFGQDYYMNTLNEIYHLQPQNADRSPAGKGFFDMELCRIFTELALLKQPHSNNAEEKILKETVQGTSVQQHFSEDSASYKELPNALTNINYNLSKMNASEFSNDNVNIHTWKEPEFVSAPNAGLVLIAPWFPRLFGMLGFLNEEKKDFKDTESRIRAIFVLQYLIFSCEKEYKEPELAFNRILVSCPFTVPLPRLLELTEVEKDTAESMLKGVKGNWQKMQNTSINGFQQSFINRSGRLEQQENKWMLTVEKKAFDMLLDSLPWSYSLIRFPWLKKQIDVIWRSKENNYL